MGSSPDRGSSLGFLTVFIANSFWRGSAHMLLGTLGARRGGKMLSGHGE